MTLTYEVYNGDCIEVMSKCLPHADMIFADPPDNIGLKYDAYGDSITSNEYKERMERWLEECLRTADIVWWSFNARYTALMGEIYHRDLRCRWPMLKLKPCVQTYTFYQHNQHDLGNAHRPLWRFSFSERQLFPNNIRIPSWRQLNGDKRADTRGKVPGDVFDFPRVVGNSAKRRGWCPTQLHEDLVARCILLCTKPGDLVFDPFAGSGTTMRVCRKLERSCITSDVDPYYCEQIARENQAKLKFVACRPAA